MSDKEKFQEHLKRLHGFIESCLLEYKDVAPQAVDALVNDTFKKVGAPNPEAGAELCLRKLGSKLIDAVTLYDECYAELGFESRFSTWVRK